jgi:hypothetical protein
MFDKLLDNSQLSFADQKLILKQILENQVKTNPREVKNDL